MDDTALATVSVKTMAERLVACQWAAQMNATEKRALAHLALAYGMDPLMNELIWYEHKPYITVDGHIRIAERDGRYEGMEIRPMTTEERKDYNLVEIPHVWICHVYKKGMRVPATGIGTGDPNKPHRNSAVERERPWAMARVRAINQALRLYFPHKLPLQSAEEAGIEVDNGRIVTGDYVDGEMRIVTSEGEEKVVDRNTGEIDPPTVEAQTSGPTNERPSKAKDIWPVIPVFTKTQSLYAWGKQHWDLTPAEVDLESGGSYVDTVDWHNTAERVREKYGRKPETAQDGEYREEEATA